MSSSYGYYAGLNIVSGNIYRLQWAKYFNTKPPLMYKLLVTVPNNIVQCGRLHSTAHYIIILMGGALYLVPLSET